MNQSKRQDRAKRQAKTMREPGCERGIGYWARSALGLHEPADLPSHTRPPHWFDADRSGFSEPRS